MTCCSVVYGSQDNDYFCSPLPLNYRPVWAANDVPYDVISGITAELQKVYPHISVMPHGLVRESEEKQRAHFLHTGTPSATGLSGRLYRYRHFHKPVFSYLSRLTMGHCSNLSAASAAIDQYLLLVVPTAANPTPTAANLQYWVCCCGPMLGQTDGWTQNHFIDPALHTMWTVCR